MAGFCALLLGLTACENLQNALPTDETASATVAIEVAVDETAARRIERLELIVTGGDMDGILHLAR